MEKSNIDLFVATMSDKFPAEKAVQMRSQLEKMEDNKLPILQSLNYQNPLVIFLISFLLGGLGIDRFMLGQIGLGVGKLLTCGGLGVWALIDLFMIMKATKEYNYQLFMKNAY